MQVRFDIAKEKNVLCFHQIESCKYLIVKLVNGGREETIIQRQCTERGESRLTLGNDCHPGYTEDVNM